MDETCSPEILLLKKQAQQSRLRLISLQPFIVKGPGGSWVYKFDDHEPSVHDYTIVCSSEPLTKRYDKTG
ncbi:ORF7b [Gammacoronavirus brantae]|uniref:ORF7b n=1 Tax=Canada goose coronavirus TaxID=2569586 RepID=A0A4D6FTP0_9GAMC|nr:ORF7b [Canada goose coronavirus]QCB65094.1 ORF7b [Canada goose coronavirus]